MGPTPIYNYDKSLGEKYIILDVFCLGAVPAFDDEDSIELQGVYFTIIEKGKHGDWAVVQITKNEQLEWVTEVGQYIKGDDEAAFDRLLKEQEEVLTDAFAALEAKANEKS
jgi:hypothetical protein